MSLDDPMMMAVLGGVALLVIVLFLCMPDDGAKAMEKRLKRITQGDDQHDKIMEAAQKYQLRRDMKDSGIPFLDRLIKTLVPNPKQLRQRLAATGTAITISEYFLITGVTAGICITLFKLLFGLKALAAILLGIALGIFLPHSVVGMMAKSRAKKFIKFFPESIDAMVRGIRSGLPVSESINAVGEEMPDPIGMEFRSIRDAVRMGRSLEDAMWDVAKRIDVPEYRYLIIALSIQRETGGNLAETLANVAEVLRRRRHMKLKIKAMSSEAKASAMILGALPFIMLLVLSVVSHSYISILFDDPRGNMLLLTAAGIMGTGVYIMAQMINFEI